MTIHTEVREVTPIEATEWLSKNEGNRTIRKRHVAMLVREMREGRWTVNGQGIVFADTGRLIDGQHRLEAVVQFGAPVLMMVTTGVKELAYGTLDQGVKRTAGDDLRALGVSNATQVASTVRLILLWEKGLSHKNGTLAKSEIADFIIEHPDIADSVKAAYPARKSVPTSGLSAVHWMGLRSCDPSLKARMEVFMRGLETGADLTAGSPILTLRNSGQTIRKGASMSSGGWFGLTMQAWNAFAAGESRKVFKNTNWPDKVAGYPVKRVAI